MQIGNHKSTMQNALGIGLTNHKADRNMASVITEKTFRND